MGVHALAVQADGPSDAGEAGERTELTRTGRDGLLEVAFERRDGRTVLTRRRFRAPLQVMEPVALGDDPGEAPAAWLVLLNPSGGVLAGDRLRTEIVLGEGTHVGVTTPSATRVYRSAGETAVLETRVRVGPGATLEYVPDHLVPHAGARLRQSLSIALEPGARAFVWDAVAVARPARDESWAFSHLESTIEVTRSGRPVFLERSRLAGADPVLSKTGGSEGCGYLGLFLVLDPGAMGSGAKDLGAKVPEDLAASLSAVLTEPRRGAASVLGGDRGVVARVLAPSAPELTDAFHVLWSCARRSVLGRCPPDLRKG